MRIRAAVFGAALALLPGTVFAQTSENLLVVVNAGSPQSVQIAEHYVKVRKVPARNLVPIHVPDTDVISRPDYQSLIEAPIAAWLERQRLQDQVLYLVLCKGVPLRINGTAGLSGTVASVDSELTLLYRKMTGAPTPVLARIDNPYFLGAKPISEAKRFSHLTSDLYLVTRLDGFTTEDVLKLIDRGVNPVRDGQIVLDQRAITNDRGGDAWLADAAERLTLMDQGSRLQLETTRAIAASQGPVLGYFSWGSNDPSNQRRDMGLKFAGGAIGGMFVSTDGRTFREPSPAWQPARAGSTTGGQSLAGDLIREGITGVSGHVAEPYLDAIVRPQVLFPAYLSGYTLAESYYLAMPYLSWQNIVVGDPLCAPFSKTPLRQDQIHKGVDAETDLPALFAERRLTVLKSSNLKVEGVKLFLKARSFKAQDHPPADVQELLVRATGIEPRLTTAQLELAEAAEARSDFAEAITRYRAVIAVEPNNVVALNNLAYALAERQDAAKEALPLAQRAYQLSGQAGIVADTVGWIHYKLGNAADALPLVERAARLELRNVDIQIHAAIVHASLNSLPQARAYLAAALKLDPAAADRDDVKALATRINK